MRDKFREQPASFDNHCDHCKSRWWGMAFEWWKPCIRARGGIAVMTLYENVAVGTYTSASPCRLLSKDEKNRDRKLPIRSTSTPLMKDGCIDKANEVGEGVCAALTEVGGTSTPNDIFVTATLSKSSKDGKRRVISLRIREALCHTADF